MWMKAAPANAKSLAEIVASTKRLIRFSRNEVGRRNDSLRVKTDTGSRYYPNVLMTTLAKTIRFESSMYLLRNLIWLSLNFVVLHPQRRDDRPTIRRYC